MEATTPNFDNEVTFKVVVVGNAGNYPKLKTTTIGVGKSSLIQYYTTK